MRRFSTCWLWLHGLWVAAGSVLVGCGDSMNTGINVPVAVSNGLEFRSVSAGFHSCGVTVEGAAFCWGENVFGALGDSTNTDSNVPVAVWGGLTLDSVSAGYFHSCGVTGRSADPLAPPEGAAYCWGENVLVVVDTTLADSTPPAEDTTRADSTSSAKHTTLANSNVPVPVAGGLTFQAVSAGDNHSCGVTGPLADPPAPGAAYCWGLNKAGALGNGTTQYGYEPVAVSKELAFWSVSAGSEHSCGVTGPSADPLAPPEGAAYCWGFNDHGQLGDGTNTDSNVPVAVSVSSGLEFLSVSAGSGHSCGVVETGAAYCWGRNIVGQLGDGTNTDSNVPVAVSGEHAFQSVSAGQGSPRSHSCGVTRVVGDAYCWGDNFFGALGDGTTTNSRVPVRVDSPF